MGDRLVDITDAVALSILRRTAAGQTEATAFARAVAFACYQLS
jgi:hypothetical protein